MWMFLRAGRHRSALPCGGEAALVLVPCEPASVTGSRGDEAMIYAILQNFRRRHPEGKIAIVCCSTAFQGSDDGKRLQRDFPRLEYIAAWRGVAALWRIAAAIKRFGATEAAVLGADCMDGHYSPDISEMLLMIADIASRRGIATHLTGFSFNENPHPRMLRLFPKTGGGIVFNLRDPESHKRFVQHFPMCNARLVADVAFLLEPAHGTVHLAREEGIATIGFNVHGMLCGDAETSAWRKEVAGQLAKFLEMRRGVAIAMIPHDYRPQGDLPVLREIYACLPDEAKRRVRIVDEKMSAAELKALAGELDALFTSRMHLGIAALGMGRPVAAFAYQGKFEGLFKHVALPGCLILAPGDAARLAQTLAYLADNAQMLGEGVKKSLPGVLRLAAENLEERAQR